ncbi:MULTISPECIES: crotonyl-CoA carboxylase/reductase [unclassified Brenneria]|uniref:crotonyl-CoA carboxylase/reductase n=1 Tax=unclassified Brenneria TaxID=2634434 RepID=UPI00155280AD|nr:crotonyl-CoA carboxylase/reductase [Brenneria sp. hezel4-2-4]MEE3650591.1 crotonyl-CoA carboxylase/reductase [Brenneria sp. HEZEL_4_2_4]NPD00546.1 crotonyl-CoA carboxylase/reductase [Brenneria sp. hezel4-2-4]
MTTDFAIPKTMKAYLIRPERYGDPITAIQPEIVNIPELSPQQVLIKVMASGLNYNNVWAATGKPVDVISARRKKNKHAEPFHIGGSEASGIVYAVGGEVSNVKVGDAVVISCSVYDATSLESRVAADPMFTRSQEIYGYERNYGSFAEYTVVENYQCYPKPDFLTWEESATLMLNGPTAYKQLTHWAPNIVKPGDPVLIWGAAGGLGSLSVQIVKALGGLPVAVVSSEEKGEYVRGLGAVGYIIRRKYSHFGRLPDVTTDEHASWSRTFANFRRDFFKALGKKELPKLVIEHSGQDTFPTSLQICDHSGMVVTVGGTSGYNCDFDVRHLWMHQKRIQGSHYANIRECWEFLHLVNQKRIVPTMNRVFKFDEIPYAHQQLLEGKIYGNAAVLINATSPRLGSVTEQADTTTGNPDFKTPLLA